MRVIPMDFEEFMRENGPMVYTLAVRLTGNVADGHDLAQDTFIKAYQHFREFRGDSSPSTWLYRICVNAWKNRVRYEKRRHFWKHFSLSSKDGEPASEIAASEPGLGSTLENADSQSLVQNALKQLDSEDRAILVLRDMEDRSYEDIADILGVPMGTVKSRLARSRERLRQILERHLKDIR